MKILLAHNSLYYPFAGGGDKSNRLLMEAMARFGHQVRVVSRVEEFGPAAQRDLLDALRARGFEDFRLESGAVLFELNGTEVHTVTLDSNLRAYFDRQIREFDPDVIVTSTDDPAMILFDVAVRAPRAHVVYLVRATIATPFGPDSSSPNPERTARLRAASAWVGVSEYVAKYTRDWGGVDAIHVPISLLDTATPSQLGRFENPYVLMVNPCAVKGISIFAELARRMPGIRFGAVPAWGTTAEDRELLASLPNVTLLGFRDNIDELLALARVTLVPSLWAEARSRMVVESFSRGVPVMAADTGGLHEAMLGVDYLLPVNPVRHYKPALNRQMVPMAEVPPQDVDPWERVLRRLVTEKDHWSDLSRRSRDAAMRYMSSLDGRAFAEFLEAVVRRPKAMTARAAPVLSPEKKKLLELRMKQRSNPWLPGIERKATRPRLIVLPHAGSGAGPYLGWRSRLEPFEVCPVMLPGRESRLREVPCASMAELVAALDDALAPYLEGDFAVFGHSMGAGIAFEWVRHRRDRGEALPSALIVSAARAPDLRRAPLTEPSDPELAAQIESHLGRTLKPGEREILLPIAKADTKLFRDWIPSPHRTPLPVPVVAYFGRDDASLDRTAMEGWGLETASRFRVREFAGGHFYFRDHPEQLFAALAHDLSPDSL